MEQEISDFIDKLIKEYQEHLSKGNTTLGTLPNDWKIELEQLIDDYIMTSVRFYER